MWQKWSNEILISHLPETNLRPNIIHETMVLGTLAVRWQRLAIKWGEIQCAHSAERVESGRSQGFPQLQRWSWKPRTAGLVGHTGK